MNPVSQTGQPAQDCDVDLARCIVRVVRALYNGHCPRCGLIFPTENARRINGVQCPVCLFSITRREAEEAEDALKVFDPVMRRSLAVFHAWRKRQSALSGIAHPASPPPKAPLSAAKGYCSTCHTILPSPTTECPCGGDPYGGDRLKPNSNLKEPGAGSAAFRGAASAPPTPPPTSVRRLQDFVFDLNDHVLIRGIKTTGRVIGLMVRSSADVAYQVVYWLDGGEREVVWMLAHELELEVER